MLTSRTCPRHAAAASTICSRCGTFVCAHDDCASSSAYAAGVVCGSCVARLDELNSASWLAVASAITGFIAVGCGALGPVAILLGVIDLLRDGRRKSSLLDGIGIGLGLTGTIIAVLVFVVLAVKE